tara:strand:- start:521 stop:1321 length:801 start_codon:yes stop_codon:yes gene_type:complete
MHIFGILGNPVGHSLSPCMHQAAYSHLEMDAKYITIEPDPLDLEKTIKTASQNGISGLNVTIPFKQDVLPYVQADKLAKRIGAVNTIDFSRKKPIGYNTDIGGARRSFEHHGVNLSGTNSIVIGSGGAGRALSFMLSDAGSNVSIVNRTEYKAHELSKSVPSSTGHGFSELTNLLPESDILVNATSVGMKTDVSPVPIDSLRSDMVIMDAVYRPIETQLLKDAKEAGSTTIDGAWMLLYQGAESFEIWTGKKAPVDVMNNAIRSNL